jgi:hypothetical protein
MDVKFAAELERPNPSLVGKEEVHLDVIAQLEPFGTDDTATVSLGGARSRRARGEARHAGMRWIVRRSRHFPVAAGAGSIAIVAPAE